MSPVGPIPNQGQITAEGLIDLGIGTEKSASVQERGRGRDSTDDSRPSHLLKLG